MPRQARTQRLEHERPVIDDGEHRECRRNVWQAPALESIRVGGDDRGILGELREQTRGMRGSGSAANLIDRTGVQRWRNTLEHMRRMWLRLDCPRDLPRRARE